MRMGAFGKNSSLAQCMVLTGVHNDLFLLAHPLGQKVLGTRSGRLNQPQEQA